MFACHSKNNQVGEATLASSMSVLCGVDKRPLSRSLALYITDPMRSNFQHVAAVRCIDLIDGSIHYPDVHWINAGASITKATQMLMNKFQKLL